MTALCRGVKFLYEVSAFSNGTLLSGLRAFSSLCIDLFLTQCAVGMSTAGLGGILADEMGLGKTIQSIALIWTLISECCTTLSDEDRCRRLTDSFRAYRAEPLPCWREPNRSDSARYDRLPRHFDEGSWLFHPLAFRFFFSTRPSDPPDFYRHQNWHAEIKKWLGKDALRVMVADGPQSVKTFANSRTYQVLIVGYEKVSLPLLSMYQEQDRH